MNRKQILQFIKESRELARGAPIEQKIKLLKLIKEATMRLDAESKIVTETVTIPAVDSSKNTDYLDEV